MERNKQVTTGKQYPFPAIPTGWSRDEVQFAQGLRAIFDILFSQKISNVLLADGSVTSRVIAKKAVSLSHIVDGFGTDLDISRNSSIQAVLEVIQGLPDILYPVGIIIIADTLPVGFGTWEEVDIGLTGSTAWKRTA